MGVMRNIVVVPYDESWPQAYAGEARRIEAALAPLAVTLHHIVSTSVPGLAAKPVIDLLLVVGSLLLAGAGIWGGLRAYQGISG